jgi:exonuclease VII small subunit
VTDEVLQSLENIARRLEEGARHLSDASLEPDDAVRVAGECAELASQAAVELDRIARAPSSDPTEVPGQEELL